MLMSSVHPVRGLGLVCLFTRCLKLATQMETWWGKASHKQKFAGSSVELLVRAMLQVASCEPEEIETWDEVPMATLLH